MKENSEVRNDFKPHLEPSSLLPLAYSVLPAAESINELRHISPEHAYQMQWRCGGTWTWTPTPHTLCLVMSYCIHLKVIRHGQSWLSGWT